MKSNEPAFPHAIMGIPEDFSGMSKREYIAIAAMQALISRDIVQGPDSNNLAKWAVMNPRDNYKDVALRAYKYADAMLVEGQND